MVLFPISRSRQVPIGRIAPVWEAIERKQRECAEEWWLVAQPDHAIISGSLAGKIESSLFPRLDDDVLQAIAQHDDGWTAFDNSRHSNNGRPLSFLDVPVLDFLQAWRDSIARAQEHSAIGGILVSEHFCRIAQARPSSAPGGDLLSRFLAEEAARQVQLKKKQSRSKSEIGLLVDVLQFCDLLSLYVCCGSRESVEFPQKFQGIGIRLHREGELFRTEPAIFGGGMSFAVQARKFSDFGQGQSLPVLFS